MTLRSSRPVPLRVAADALRHNGVRVVFGLAVSGVLLWLMLRSIDTGELARALRSASAQWIAAGLAFYWIELGLRAQRWRTLLQPVRALSFAQVASALLVGYAANNVLPARLGELFRADFIGRRHAMSRLSAIGTIFIERLLDMVAVIACAALGMLWAMGSARAAGSPEVNRMLAGGLIGAAAVVGLAAALVYAAIAHPPRWLGRRFPLALAAVDAVRTGLLSVRQPRRIAALATLSAAAWSVNALATWAMLNAVGISPRPAVLLLVIGMSGLAAAIPSAPAGIGTLQFAFVAVLGAAGHPAAASFAGASLVQVFFLGSVTIAGALVYGAWSLRPGRRGAHGPR